jgi:hypothetical protein
MLSRVLRGWLGRLDRQEIGDGKGSVFFWRYRLWKSRRCSLYLHEFLRSDRSRCLHDHPWWFVSVVLRHGYREVMADGPHWRRPGSVLIRPGATFHRIEVDPGTRPWSLVIVGRKSRPWGFLTRDGWREWSAGYSPICED